MLALHSKWLAKESPMPFGSQSCEDIGTPCATRFRKSGHQCLSAVSPVRTTSSAWRSTRRTPRHQCLSAVSPVRTPSPLRATNPKTTSHQCLSAVSPVRTRFHDPGPNRQDLLSPMPFGSQSCEDKGAVVVYRPAGPSHQCLSAVSPVRTCRTLPRVRASRNVTNAFRQSVL